MIMIMVIVVIIIVAGRRRPTSDLRAIDARRAYVGRKQTDNDYETGNLGAYLSGKLKC